MESQRLGAAFLGMISTGLGELNGYFLLARCEVPSRVAVATSVLVGAITAVVAATGHGVRLAGWGAGTRTEVLSIVLFTVLGGQLGAAESARIPQHALERTLGLLFALVGGYCSAWRAGVRG